MTAVQTFKSETLARAFSAALGGKHQPLFSELTRVSGLPGTRINTSVALALADECVRAGKVADPIVDALLAQDDERAPGGVIALAGDLEVNPGLPQLAIGMRGDRFGHRLVLVENQVLELTVGAAPDDHDRVDDGMDGSVHHLEVRGDRVDEEGAVVGDDLDDTVRTAPALGLDGRVDAGDRGGADRTRAGEITVGESHGEQIVGAAGEDLLRRNVAVVGGEEVR